MAKQSLKSALVQSNAIYFSKYKKKLAKIKSKKSSLRDLDKNMVSILCVNK
jgi:predicted transcriptional regulator YheO